jgi:hypothetical protein
LHTEHAKEKWVAEMDNLDRSMATRERDGCVKTDGLKSLRDGWLSYRDGYLSQRDVEDLLERWVAKLERWGMAKLEKCWLNFDCCVAKFERWVADL